MNSGNSIDGPETAELRVGYVVKRYPRFSETFIVNEILAHEAAGRHVEILSLYPPNDTHFQDSISRVRAPVTYLPHEGMRVTDFWSEIRAAAKVCPGLWQALERAGDAAAREVYQAAVLARRVRERGLNHLHAHFASTATSVVRLAARFAGIPYTFTAHAKDIFHEEVKESDLRAKLADAAGVVTVSDFNVAHLRDRFGADARGVRRIYNGIHLDRFAFHPVPVTRRAAKVVAVGRLVEKKGFHILIDACARLRESCVAFECELIGSGEQESALRAQIANRGVGDFVKLSGALPQGEVIRRVTEAALLAAPCVVGRDGNADGLPTVLLEAMALGTPCVATDVTGIPEILRDGDTGLHVAQGDVQGLATALSRLLEDRELGQAIAVRARALIESEFEVHRNAGRVFEMFESAARAAGAGTRGSRVSAGEAHRAAARRPEVGEEILS